MSYDAPPPPPPDPYQPPPPGSQPPPGYYAPPPQAYGYAVPQTSGKATAVLVLGILSLVVCQILGIIAICLAPGAKQEIAASQGRLGGEGQIKAGVICAWVSIALGVFFVLIVILFLVGALALNS